MTGDAVIRIENLTKNYGQLTALDDVSLEVGRGELFGIIGPDGAGKSSLYKILATLLPPTRGRAFVLGLDTIADYRAIRSKIGYMPERFSLYPDMTVSENLHFFASLFGVRVEDTYDMIAPVFSQLAKFPDRKAGKLSGGMKQKLALSCALIHRPELLLLDEPTTGVDAVSRSEFWEMLRHLREIGVTIVVSTSYMDEATLCDRIAMIDHGHILCTDTPANLTANIGESLYGAVARNMFGLLTELRKQPGIIDCYTFGSTLHIVAAPGFNAQEACAALAAAGVDDARIYPTKGNIEDLFIKLTRNERH